MQVQAPPAPSVRRRPPPASHAPTALQHPCINAFQHPLSSRRRRLLQYAPPPTAPTPGPLRIQVPQHERDAASPIPTRPAPTHPELNWLRASTVSAVGDAAPRHHLRPMTHPLEVPARRAALGPSQATTRRRFGLRSSPPCVPVRKTTGRLASPFAASVAAPSVPPNAAPSTTTIASTRPTSTTAAGPFAARLPNPWASLPRHPWPSRSQLPPLRPARRSLRSDLRCRTLTPEPHPPEATRQRTAKEPAKHHQCVAAAPPPSDDHHPASSATPETCTDRRCRAAAPPAADNAANNSRRHRRNNHTQHQPPTAGRRGSDAPPDDHAEAANCSSRHRNGGPAVTSGASLDATWINAVKLKRYSAEMLQRHGPAQNHTLRA